MGDDRRADTALLVLRLAGLGLAWAHGGPKLLALVAGRGDRFVAGVEALGFPLPELFAWAAALAETVGGLLVALGLFTRVAALFAAVTMAVAAFLRHRALSHLAVALGLYRPSEETIASWGDPERALLFLAVFVALLLTGPGRLSLDRRRRRKQPPRRRRSRPD